MDFLRRGCRVSKLEHVYNTEIRRRMDAFIKASEKMETRRLIWYGHVNRMNDQRWPLRLLKWKAEGRRRRGRPEESWFKQVQEDMKSRDLSEEDWVDRKRWRLGCERRPREL